MADRKSTSLEGYAETGEGRVHYLDFQGSGPGAHFLHANGFCAGAYGPMLSHFKPLLHIIASDVKGHGSSDAISPEQVTHWKIFSSDLKAVIEKTMIPPVIGMGHSLGAVTTLIAAVRYPDLFKCIVLFDPVIFPRWALILIALFRPLGLMRLFPLAKGARRRKTSFRSRLEAFKRFAAGRGIFKTWSHEFIDAYLECGLLEKDEKRAVLRCDPELEAAIFESIPHDIWGYARKVTCPVLIVRGEKSDTLSRKTLEKLSCVIRSYEHKTIAETGHFLPMERPDACAEAVIAYLKRKGFLYR